MAYHVPSKRRERPAQSSHQASYLDDFLDHIETLPSKTRSVFHDIHTLEDRISSTKADVTTAARESVTRATTKGVPLENVKRSFQEFIHLQNNVAEFAAKKVSLANEARDCIAAAIADLDARLVDFETQLRKEGRWPATEAPPVLSPKVPRGKPTVSKPIPVLVARASPPDAPSTRPSQKARRRESSAIGIVNPTTPRAAALAAARAKEVAVKAQAAAAKEAADASRNISADVAVDTSDQSAMDSTLYCFCRRLSHGDMVGCEGKNCKIEWFHFECVGLKDAPTGAWYCDECTAAMRKKSSGGRRKAT